jgi:hypothetical protein
MVFMHAPVAPPDPDPAEVLYCSFLSLIWIPGSPDRKALPIPAIQVVIPAVIQQPSMQPSMRP